MVRNLNTERMTLSCIVVWTCRYRWLLLLIRWLFLPRTQCWTCSILFSSSSAKPHSCTYAHFQRVSLWVLIWILSSVVYCTDTVYLMMRPRVCSKCALVRADLSMHVAQSVSMGRGTMEESCCNSTLIMPGKRNASAALYLIINEEVNGGKVRVWYHIPMNLRKTKNPPPTHPY